MSWKIQGFFPCSSPCTGKIKTFPLASNNQDATSDFPCHIQFVPIKLISITTASQIPASSVVLDVRWSKGGSLQTIEPLIVI